MFYSSAHSPSTGMLSKPLRLHSFTSPGFWNTASCAFKLEPQNKGLHLFRATHLSHILVASGVQKRGSGNPCGQKLFPLLLKEALYSYFWGELTYLYVTVGLWSNQECSEQHKQLFRCNGNISVRGLRQTHKKYFLVQLWCLLLAPWAIVTILII